MAGSRKVEISINVEGLNLDVGEDNIFLDNLREKLRELEESSEFEDEINIDMEIEDIQ